MKNTIRGWCVVLLLQGIVAFAHAQIITTIAGNGSFSISGDGGPATDAGIQLPSAIAVDGAGNIYITSGGRIRKIDASGTINQFAGGGTGIDGTPAVSASIPSPSNIAVDPVGNFLLSSSNKIRKINTIGIISTVAGTGTYGYTGDGGPALVADLLSPGYVVFDGTGNLYIAHAYHIRKINTAGVITTIAGINVAGYSGDGGQATAAEFDGVSSIAIDPSGNLYFADQGNNVIRKINTAGIISTIAGNGIAGFSGDGGPASIASLHLPDGLAFDPWGNLVFTDHLNGRIRKIDPSGIITTIAGDGSPFYSGDGGPATAASLFYPAGICVNQLGDIYVNDRQNYRIRKISTYNRSPWFTHGAVATLTACGEYNPTDTLLQVMDSNATQAITWSVLTAPAHGTAVAAYTAMSTGTVLTPVGTGYTPVTGYAGPDTFRVRVTDGVLADTITVAVDVQLMPVAAPITGTDTICVGRTATLTAPPGGTWSSPDATVGVGAGTGVITGMSVGTATVSYTVSNYCGTASAKHVVTILPAGTCPTGVGNIATDHTVSISPNPNTGSFTIQLPPGSASRITVTDVTGRKILQLNSSVSCSCILPPECAGVYFAEVLTDGARWYGKVIVR